MGVVILENVPVLVMSFQPEMRFQPGTPRYGNISNSIPPTVCSLDSREHHAASSTGIVQPEVVPRLDLPPKAQGPSPLEYRTNDTRRYPILSAPKTAHQKKAHGDPPTSHSFGLPSPSLVRSHKKERTPPSGGISSHGLCNHRRVKKQGKKRKKKNCQLIVHVRYATRQI